MITVLTPLDNNFNFEQAHDAYLKYQKDLGDERNFINVILNSFFYSYFNDGVYLGSIYFYTEKNKLFVNAFANRHTHLLNLECFKQSLGYFKCNIYARALHRTSSICLLKCGFKRIKDNLFIYERN